MHGINLILLLLLSMLYRISCGVFWNKSSVDDKNVYSAVKAGGTL